MKKVLFAVAIILIALIILILYKHFIHDDGIVAKLCNGKEYDSKTYRCESGELIGNCKGKDYYLTFQICDDKGNILDKKSLDTSSYSVPECKDKQYDHTMQFCSDGVVMDKGEFTDSRDGQKYKYVKIGNHTWMAENLNYNSKESKCYANNPENCKKYGRLYLHERYYDVCPSGWHLPTEEEWKDLLIGKEEDHYNPGYLSIGKDDGTKLKAIEGWNNNGNGTDSYGFTALPGGYGNRDGSFSEIGNYGGWWHINPYSYSYDIFGFYMHCNSNDAFAGNPYNRSEYSDCPYVGGDKCKMAFLSVRCVKNYECGKTTSDPSKRQECCDNSSVYDGFSQFCKKGKVYDKCGEVGGGEIYDPETEFCYKNNKNGDDEVRKKNPS